MGINLVRPAEIAPPGSLSSLKLSTPPRLIRYKRHNRDRWHRFEPTGLGPPRATGKVHEKTTVSRTVLTMVEFNILPPMDSDGSSRLAADQDYWQPQGDASGAPQPAHPDDIAGAATDGPQSNPAPMLLPMLDPADAQQGVDVSSTKRGTILHT